MREPGSRPWWCSSSTSSRPTACSGPTAASTPSAIRTSRTWPPTPPGSRTPTRSTTRPSSRCRRSWTRSLPRRGTAADYRSHRRSIYHLMDGLGYGIVDVESGEALCPPRICPGARARRPGVLKRLAGSGRPATAARLDRGDPQARAADLLLPARAAAARAVDLPAVRSPEQAEGQRSDPEDQRPGRLPRRRAHEPQRDAPPAAGGLRGPPGGRPAGAPAADRTTRRGR